MPGPNASFDSSLGDGVSRVSAPAFHRYLENVRAFMQSSQMHMTSACVSMERCRGALEWQNAVQTQFANMNETIEQNLLQLAKLGEDLSARKPAAHELIEWERLMSATLELQKASLCLIEKSRQYQLKLAVLNESIASLEEFSCEVALLNDWIEESASQVEKSFLN